MTDTLVEPVAYRHRYTDPLSGKLVWRRTSERWNGQKPSASEPLYPAAALWAAQEEIERLTRERDAAVERGLMVLKAKNEWHATATRLQADVDALLWAGSGMANVIYNTVQTSFGTPELRQSMKDAQVKWDQTRARTLTKDSTNAG